MGNIGTWGAGATPSRSNPEYYKGNIPWLKTGDLNDGYIIDIPEHISQTALEETSAKLNPSGSVLIAMYGATIGKLGILTYPATTNQACCACISYNGINNLYLFYFLMSQRKEFIDLGVGGAQSNISKEKIINTLIPIPSNKEQNNIVKQIEQYLEYLQNLDLNKNNLQELIKLLKSKILDLAIRGKLVPQDPNDEPADVLLERIRKEKEKLIKQGKIKRDKKESIIFKGDDNSYYEKIDNSSICIDDELPFEKPENWVYVRLEDIVSYEQPTPYIVTSTNYSKKYKTPVLTAGKSFIIGYTNEDFGIRKKLPAIIFDDFTTDLRLINFPFKVKSSAMKILSVDEDLMSYDYAYYTMKCVDCDHYNHKRYWISDFSKKIITLPPKEEQERILKRINDVFKFLELIEKSLS